ncbi:glycoside hydrolase family 43 protein [Amycolatopsis balhimycina DSM 5908]|uniref:Glycoside hydrolase family 43 protein n=1 Tax=Amycolatopsis balhimycina DSM 5908 TaxID=1081091 RepID=A0A428WJD7_AMYBA|nr:glycoside hydrolase family 43 protein [Amycolatopsis balhimycina]RSM43173.1 glycoside hydrolase family 43 protein [Amycolatopsis balhimycina DSM 5908]
MTLPNPLIPGFNPDPSCVLVDGTYYLVTSSFEYLPGLPVYRSTDFVTWEHVGNVAVREEQVGVGQAPAGAGVWAPTLRHHDGLFHVIVSVTAGSRRCVVFTAEDPAGPWSEGTSIDGVVGIDPDLAWDETGAAYVTYSALELDGVTQVGFHGIRQARVDLDAGKVLEEPRSLWSGTGLVAPEAPHLYRRDGYWYLFIAEGGTGSGHAVSVARGPSIEGPFEGAPSNPVLSASGRYRPVQCTGHADLVRGPDGDDVLVLLGTRAAGAASPLGRETYVTTVEWLDGWPCPAPVDLAPRPEPLDELFDFADCSAPADPGWLAVGRMPGDVASLGERPGHLTISAGSGGIGAFRPGFVGRRQRHLISGFETTVDPADGSGGLGLRFDEDFTIALVAERVPSRGIRVTARASLPALTREWVTELVGERVVLRLETDTPPPGRAPWSPLGDRIRLIAADEAGTETQLAELDGRFWSVEMAAPFTGRVVGMFAERGAVHFAGFRYHGEDPS